MKKATRIARRMEREKVEKQLEIYRQESQAIYDEKIKQKKVAERTEFYKSCVKFCLIAALFVVPISIIVHKDNIEEEKRQAVLTVKLNTWNNYKKKSCKEVEKIFGMRMGSGKFSYIDDGTVYQCDNGMKYTLSDKAAKGEMGIDSIPNIRN